MKFTYNNGKGKITHRDVEIICGAKDYITAIDLTDYSPEDRDYLREQLLLARQQLLDRVEELGLNDNWRRFKEVGISNVREV